MVKVVSVAEIREIEATADLGGLSYATMMQNAGRAIATRAITYLRNKSNAQVTVLVGVGNNGGDGLVSGLLIAQELDISVRFYLLKSRSTTDANFSAVQNANLPLVLASDDPDGSLLYQWVASASIVIDSIFGIGISLPLRADAAKVLAIVKEALNNYRQPQLAQGYIISPADPKSRWKLPKPYVIAVDCPSGLDCDTGKVDSNTIIANETITFIAAKKGLLEFPGAAFVGDLHVATIGITDEISNQITVPHSIVSSDDVVSYLPDRPLNGNKGTFGKVLAIAGSRNYVGAAGLSAMSAYHSGVGLVTVAAPSSVVTALSGRFLEPTWIRLEEIDGALVSSDSMIISELVNYNAVLLGPGWGRAKSTKEFLLNLLSRKLPKLVIDADGLNLLGEIDNWWLQVPSETVITPHPGEMGRLARITTEEVLANRWDLITTKSAEWNVVIVLKGAHTLVAAPDGRVAVLPFKSDALSTAGTGDVLAGLITGFIAQGVAPYNAAILGCYIHGLAGNIAAEIHGNSRSVVAGDVLNAIGRALSLLKS